MLQQKSAILPSRSWQLYRRLLRYVYPHRFAFILSIIGYAIFSATTVAAGKWLGWATDALYSDEQSYWRIMLPATLMLITLCRGIGGFLGSYTMAHVSNHVVHKLRCDLVSHMIKLPVSYYDKTTTGSLVSRITYDVNQVAGAASNALTVTWREGMTVIGLLIGIMWIDWQLSLVFLLVAPLVAFTVNAASKYFRRYSTQMQNSMADVTQITNESIKGHRVVRTFNAQDFVVGRFVSVSEKNRRQNMKMTLAQDISTPLIQLIVSLAMSILVWLAMAPEFLANQTPGDFIAFLGLAAMLAKPIRQLSNVNSIIQRGLAAVDSIFALLDTESEKDQGQFTVARAAGRVEFNNLCFGYDIESKTRALKNISFVAEPGQSIALVGKSGSGKTSLVNLIPRFYEHTTGSILLDGIELSDYKLENLRQQISLVTQQVVLFNGSIAENIAYGCNGDIDRDLIEAAARNAHAMEFIQRMPEGLDTQVGDDAGLLSGGQRQRIAIARALLIDAPILILDEATSALDSESERHIQIALETLMKGRTTFVIAHRLSTIESADIILVMRDGEIIESGNHKELIREGGHYAYLHKIQFSENGTVHPQ